MSRGYDKHAISVSATRISMFLQCKYRYWANYVLHLPKLPNTSFKLGMSVHEALKIAGRIWRKKESFSSYDIKKIKDHYRKVAAKEGIEDLSIFKEGLLMLSNKLKNFEVGKIIDIENRFNVVTPDGVKIIGAMDKVVELDKDSVLIVDYKTSKFVYTPGELKNDIQLSLYDLVGSIKFPDYKRIILCLDYLRQEPVYSYRTYRERQDFLKYVTSIYNEMINLKEENATPELNDMCNWCDFREQCPAYIKAMEEKTIARKRVNDLTENELIEEYIQVKNKKRVLDSYEKKLKSFIIEKIERDSKDLTGNDNVIYIRQNPSIIYDVKTAYESLPIEDFLKVVTVHKKQLDGYMDKDPVAAKKILETATKGYKFPFLSTRKK